MAQVIERPTVAGTETPRTAQQPATENRYGEYHVTDMFEQDEKESVRRFFGWPPSGGMIMIVVFAAILGSIAFYVFKTVMGPLPNAASVGIQTAAAQTVLIQPSAQDLKEISARDAYAVALSKELHAKVTAYKDVEIYADNLVGIKAPNRTPHVDPKTRPGDNFMLVFSSPESQTAKGLADFTKSKAAQQATAAGFEEFQFVDPQTYCYSLVTAGPTVGAVKCGVR